MVGFDPFCWFSRHLCGKFILVLSRLPLSSRACWTMRLFPQTIGMLKTSQIFEPYPWQVEAWEDKSPVLLLTGAAGGGKSRLAAEKIHAYMLKYPGATGVMGRKDRTSANRSVVPFMIHTVQGDTTWGRYKQAAGLFEYALDISSPFSSMMA